MEFSHNYRIGQIAERTGVSVETLKYYEKRRLLNAPARRRLASACDRTRQCAR